VDALADELVANRTDADGAPTSRGVKIDDIIGLFVPNGSE